MMQATISAIDASRIMPAISVPAVPMPVEMKGTYHTAHGATASKVAGCAP
jgi:hypothetical protein